MKQHRTHSLSSWRQLGDIELIPPNAEDFCIYGSAKTIAAAKRWALRNRYMLVKGVCPCAHGLLGLRQCPAKRSAIADFDHTEVWANLDGRRPEVFVLMAPYLKEPSTELKAYAKCHGLRVDQNRRVDGWYGNGTIPIRLSFYEQNYLGHLEDDQDDDDGDDAEDGDSVSLS